MYTLLASGLSPLDGRYWNNVRGTEGSKTLLFGYQTLPPKPNLSPALRHGGRGLMVGGSLRCLRAWMAWNHWGNDVFQVVTGNSAGVFQGNNPSSEPEVVGSSSRTRTLNPKANIHQNALNRRKFAFWNDQVIVQTVTLLKCKRFLHNIQNLSLDGHISERMNGPKSLLSVVQVRSENVGGSCC